MSTPDVAPPFQPTPEGIGELMAEAAERLTTAALGYAVLELQEQAAGPVPEHVPAGAEEAWRQSLRQTLAELRRQIVVCSSDPDGIDEDTNLSAISECRGAAASGVRQVLDRAKRAAVTQARVVALVDRHLVGEAIENGGSTEKAD